VIVANARKLKAVTQEEVRNDRRDAEQLAQLAYWSPKLLKRIQHRSAERQRDRTVIQARATLVRARTMIINATRGLVKSLGRRLPACSAESFPNKAKPWLPAELAELIGPRVNQVQALHQPIDKLDQPVEALVQPYPEIRTREHFLDWGRAKSNPATAIRRARSPGPATPTGDRSWCSRRITGWGPSGRIRLSGGGDSSLRPAAASVVRNEPWWLWLVN
jgi:transposase